jgi:PAS domain S-box-containing protein
MPSILLVDDRPQNLLALQAILDPLGQELVKAGSGAEALKILLARDDFAAILLDVQMPELDGFETAELIKERERTRNIPIIFLTALSKEQRHVFRGYQVGAVDYVLKPFEPEVLRGKVAVFVELHEKNAQLRRQAELLALQELAAVRRESAERYRQLADAMPQIVWTADPEGRATYYNRRWFEYTGMTEADSNEDAWTRVTHPDDLPEVLDRRAETLDDGSVFEAEYRFRALDGTYRWHLGRAVPIRRHDGAIDFRIGTATDIDDRKRIEERQRFLLDAGAELSRSLDYRAALVRVALLAVPRVADWCAVDLVEPDGTIVQLTVEHSDPAKVIFARELQERYPPEVGHPTGPAAAIASGESQFVPEVSDEMLAKVAVDETHLRLIQELGIRSWICVPMVARGRVLGAIALVAAESVHAFDQSDLRLAEELAHRAATAVDNAQLYEEAEQRARASRALQTIADGVVLLDNEGTVLLWNASAEAITGLRAAQVIGRNASEALPLYAQAAAAKLPLDGSRAETMPIEIQGRELWLSVSRVRFDEGSVYAFRDVTQERALDQMRSDMVATVSHELRTPLAAIYGAAVTLERREGELEESVRQKLVHVISEESERLTRIVAVVLLANHLDSGRLQLQIETVDAVKLTASVVDTARVHLPDGLTVEFEPPSKLPPVAADEQQLRQVLVNLLENAVKYSPDGGPVTIRLTRQPRHVQWEVSDHGLGIPPAERRRVFEKFYRLDPNMTRGVGGTGLGLYICRELVRRFEGRIWVDSNNGHGSTFFVQIPIASQPAKRKARAQQVA